MKFQPGRSCSTWSELFDLVESYSAWSRGIRSRPGDIREIMRAVSGRAQTTATRALKLSAHPRKRGQGCSTTHDSAEALRAFAFRGLVRAPGLRSRGRNAGAPRTARPGTNGATTPAARQEPKAAPEGVHGVEAIDPCRKR